MMLEGRVVWNERRIPQERRQATKEKWQTKHQQKERKKPVRKNKYDDDDDYSDDGYVPSSEEEDDGEDKDFDGELMVEDEDEGVFHLVAKETKKGPKKASREIEVSLPIKWNGFLRTERALGPTRENELLSYWRRW